MFELLIFTATLATLIAAYVAVTSIGSRSNPEIVRYVKERAAKAEAEAIEAARERIGIN